MVRFLAVLLGALCVVVFILAQARPQAVADAPSVSAPCVSYAPFERHQTPFDATLVIPPEQIERDMKGLSTFTRCVRTYSTGQGLDKVPEIAARHGITTLLGAWIGRTDADNREELDRLIQVANARPETLRGVIVGNEVMLRGEQTAAGLGAYIRQVRQAIPAAVPVTTADVWEFWEQNAELAAEVDFVTVHILPYWEDDPTGVDVAVAHVMEVWEEMTHTFAPKPILIGETGWPSEGRRREDAEPSRVAQAHFVRGILSAAAAAGADVNLIEAFDQPWKRALEGTVGGAWGLFTTDRTLKTPLTGPVAERPSAPLWLVGGVLVGLLPLAFTLARRERPGALPLATLAAGGVFAGAVLVLQGWHLLAASRGLDEWAVNLGWLGASSAMAVAGLRALAGLPCRLPLEPLRALAVAGMTVASLGLVFDPRYRDLPASMFLIPALLFALLPPTAGTPREHRAVALLLTVAAVVVLVKEGVANTHAWVWTVTALALAAPALLSRAPAAEHEGEGDAAATAAA